MSFSTTSAFYFYALVIFLAMILGTYIMKSNPILGSVNGFTAGLVVAVILYNVYKNSMY